MDQREARALCLRLLLHSQGDAVVMKGFVGKRGLTFIKGWLSEENMSASMIKLLLSTAKVGAWKSCLRPVIGVIGNGLIPVLRHVLRSTRREHGVASCGV